MTRFRLYDDAQLGTVFDEWVPNRRRFGMHVSPTGTGFVTYGIGNAFASGGAVTQATDKATGVTLNTLTGLITMNNAALTAGVEVSFTVTNPAVAATDTVIVNHASAGTAGAYLVNVSTVAAGSFVVTVSNASAGNLSEAIVLGFTVVKPPFFKHEAVVGTGAAANGDVAGGSFLASLTSTSSGDASKIVTATAVTRRDWNPWVRFRFGAGPNIAAIRLWVGAFSSDPSALDTLATLSAACFGYDTVTDTTVFWRCKSGNTSAQQSTTTEIPVVVSGSYTGEIRMDTANSRIDFYMAYHGLSTAVKTQSPLVKVASHATSVPVATTPLLLGATVTAQAAAAKRILIGSVEGSQD